MVLQLTGVHLVLWIVCRVLIEVWEENRLAVRWLDVFARTSIAVATRANLVIERAVDLVLLGSYLCVSPAAHKAYCTWGRTEDRSKIVRHVWQILKDCGLRNGDVEMEIELRLLKSWREGLMFLTRRAALPLCVSMLT